MKQVRNRWGYATAILSVAIAVLVRRYLFDNVVGEQFPLALFLIAVLITAWVGGAGRGY